MRKTVVSIAIFALLAVPAMAEAKGPGGGGGGGGGRPKPSGGSGTISLVLVNSPDSVANHGETITFNVSTTATTQPAVEVNCYQGTTHVMYSSAGFYPSYPWGQNFVLESGAWTSGAADCTGRLYSTSSDGMSTTTLATTSFHVDA